MIPRQAQRLSLLTALILPALLLCLAQTPLWGARGPQRVDETPTVRLCPADRGRGEVGALVVLDGAALPEPGVAPEGVRVLLRRDDGARHHVWVEDARACHIVTLPMLDDPEQRLVHVLLPAGPQRRAAVALRAAQATYTIDLARPRLVVTPSQPEAHVVGEVILGESAVLESAREWTIR